MITNPTIHTEVARLRHGDVLDEAARAHRAGPGGDDQRAGHVLRGLIARVRHRRGTRHEPAADVLPQGTPLAKR